MMPEPADPVSNQRLESDPGPLRAILYSLTERCTDYHVSWMFKEFQIGMCPGLMSVRPRTPEVLPLSYSQGGIEENFLQGELPVNLNEIRVLS